METVTGDLKEVEVGGKVFVGEMRREEVVVGSQVTGSPHALKAYLQLRVSDRKQKDRYGPDVQRHDAHIGSTRCPIPYSLSPDRETLIVETASSWNRKKFALEMQKRLEEFHRGEWGILVFPRVDRESRFLVGSFDYLSSAVKAGIPVWFAREQLLLTNEQTEESKLAWDRYLDLVRDARAYIRVLRMNTSEGRERAMEDGKIPTGWGPWGLSGFDWKNGRFQKNGVSSTVERILRLYLQPGSTESAITKALHGAPTQTGKGFWWQSSVAKVLRHARWYAGVIAYKGKDFRGLIDPLITEQEAELILKKLGKKPRPTAYGRAGWWTGRVTCGLCERRYSISKSHGCRCNGTDTRMPNVCPGPQLGFDEFVNNVQSAIRRTLSHQESLMDEATHRHSEWVRERQLLQVEFNEKDRRLAEFKSREERLSRQHEMGRLSDELLLKRLSEVEADAAGLKERVRELSSLLKAKGPPEPGEVAKILRWFDQLFDDNVSIESMPDLAPLTDQVALVSEWRSPNGMSPGYLSEVESVLLASLGVGEQYGPTNNPTTDEVWRRVADRLNLRIVIYPPKEPGTKADIRIIGEFAPNALSTQPGLIVGTATVNTLPSWRERRKHPLGDAD